MKSTPSPRFPLANKPQRFILLTLVSLVAVAALLSLAVSANKASRAAKARAEQSANVKSAISPLVQEKVPNAPTAAVIVATLTDNTAAATKVAPGGVINYTATITNNGAASPADDATNLSFSAPLDANTTLVGGSVHASPLAFNDTYNWVGNTQLDTVARVLPAVTANDVAVNAPAGTDTFTVTAIAGGATALGGLVTLASPAGSFVYTPPVGRPNIADGATVQDSFTYAITNSADPTLTATGTVRINLTGRVWYLQAGAAGDGRSNTPSGSPSAMSTAADKATDIFYIFSNAGSLNGPFSIDAGQQLLGQGVNLVVSAITLFNAAAPTPTTTNTAGSCVALAGAPGNNTLSGFNIGNCTGGTAITGANVGTLNVSTMSISTNGGALDLTGVGAPTVSVVLGGTTSTGGAKNVNLVGLNGTFTLAGGGLSSATGNAFDVSGGTAVITYSGTISNSGAKQVNIANKTGGSVALSGAVNGTGTGINLTTNTGATINFTGGVAINSGAGIAFNATGGGTVNVTGVANALTATSATALNVANTTIGASHLTFHDISSGNNSVAADPVNGIVLNNTGASGRLIITGAGNTSVGGNSSGGVIQHTTGHGISLTNTLNPSFTNVTIHDITQNAIFGTSVTGFTFDNGQVTNTGTGGPDQFTQNGIAFVDAALTATTVSGSVVITDSLLSGVRRNAIMIETWNGTISNLNISNNTLSGPSLAAAVKDATLATNADVLDAIHVFPQGTASQTANLTTGTINNNTISGFEFFSNPIFIGGNGIRVAGGSGNAGNATTGTLGTAANPIEISGNDVDFVGSNSIAVSFNGVNGISNFNIHSNGTVANPMSNAEGLGISVFFGGSGTFSALVNNNAVNNNGPTVHAGSSGIAVQADDGPAGLANSTGFSTIHVNNNSITNPDGFGIRGIARASSCTLNLYVQNNDVGTPFLTNREAIRIDSGSAAGDTTLNLNMTGNSGPTVSTSDLLVGSGIDAGIGVRKQGTVAGTNEFNIQGIAAAPTNAQVQAYLGSPDPPGKNFTAAAGGAVGSNANGNGVDIISGSNYGTTNVVARSGGIDARPDAAVVTHAPQVAAKRGVEIANAAAAPMTAKQGSSKDSISPVLAKATPKASAAEVASIYRSERAISHHAVRKSVFSQEPNAPTAGENVTLNTITTFPGAGKSITIKYAATVNTTALTARQASTQGTITANAGAINVQTDDPDVGGVQATITLLDTTLTWTGATDTNWNTATNWNRPGPVVSSYAPGVSNPAVNDVIIPAVATQPTIGTTDIGVYSLSLANTVTLTITNPRILTIGGSPGGDLTLNGIISGGFLNLGTGTHVINNAGGTGSLSSTNVATVLTGATVTLNNNLQAGALGVNAGGSMTIATRTLSLNGTGGLVVPGGATFTTTGSTVIFNGTAAQQAAGIAYNNLTINNTAAGAPNALGATLAGNATVNGVLALTSNDLNTGGFTLTQPNTTASTGAGDVVGAVQRTGGPFGLISLTFGNPNNIITFTGAGTRPTTMTAVLAKTAPATYAAAVQRNYTLSQTGGSLFTATVRLHYLDSELNGNTPETALGLRRLRTADSHWVAAPPPPGVPTRDGAANWIEATGVLAADLTTQWTFSALVPTASGGSVTGRIVDDNGNPVEGAVVRLNGTQNRKFITDANGFYRFDNVETNGFYTVTPSRGNYSFTPSVRSFSQIGESTEAAFGATLTTSTLANPLDTPEYFVRQHYVDFLNREPDEAGFNFWSDQIIECSTDQNCFERRRENVSAAFFLSIEFQKTGGLVDGLYRAAYGARPDFAHFLPDTRTVGLGVQVGKDGWETLLATNSEAFVNSFVNRAEFHAAYDNLSNADYVDTLISHTGVSFTAAERDALLSGLGTGSMTRAQAFRSIAEDGRFVSAKFNETFVMMEYFGYLRRDADASGFAFWLNKLNQFNGNFEQAEMVKAFIVSGEYRDRFPR